MPLTDYDPDPDRPASGPEEFLAGRWWDVDSSNLAAAKYEPEREVLTIRYRNGSAYEYEQVTRQEAEAFAAAGSKGSWTWDNLRVRGTKDGFRKPFRQV